jgi:hypothetical protein
MRKKWSFIVEPPVIYIWKNTTKRNSHQIASLDNQAKKLKNSLAVDPE